MATLHVDERFTHFTSSFSEVCGYRRSHVSDFVAFSKVSTPESVFKSFHSGERFQKFAVTVCVFAEYVWTKAGSVTKCLRIQTNPDTCGQDLEISWDDYLLH